MKKAGILCNPVMIIWSFTQNNNYQHVTSPFITHLPHVQAVQKLIFYQSCGSGNGPGLYAFHLPMGK